MHTPPSPVKPKVLTVELDDYETSLSRKLIGDFSFGFKLDIVGDKQPTFCTNHKSAIQKPEIVYGT